MFDLFDEGILPYPTSFPNEDDVMDAINSDLFNLAEVDTYTSGLDAIEEIENFSNSIFDFEEISDFPEFDGGDNIDEQISKTAPNQQGYNEGWSSVSYAYGLANSHFRPKLRFMFYVDFMLKSEFSELANEHWAKNMMFNAKSVDRPRISIDYEEINQYNYRTKVAKSSKYDECSITFYDDSSNSVIDFVRFILTLMHPITRRSNSMSSNLMSGNIDMLTGHGMSFSGDNYDTNDFSHRGVINTDNGQVIQVIKVTQSYIVPSGDRAARQISYLYVNPIITSIDLSELSAEDSSNPCEVTIKFSYDAVLIPNTEGLETPRNPMPNVGSVESDFSINTDMSSASTPSQLAGFGSTVSRNISTASSLSEFTSQLIPPSSSGYTASSFIPGLNSSRNVSLDGIISQAENTVITGATKYGMAQLSPQVRRTVSAIEQNMVILPTRRKTSSTSITSQGFLNDDFTPGDDNFDLKV